MAALRRAWVEEDAGPVDEPAYEQAFADWYAAEGDHRVAWIAFVDGTPAGMLNLLEYRRMPRPGRLDSRWGYVSNVFVLGRYRNRGLGRELLDAMLAFARERSYARLVLSPSERARPLYERVGFGPVDELLLQRL
jgi:GNAT superfamily N-acetyltransferase